MQDVIIGPMLADVVRSIRTRPRQVVVLGPAPAVVAERAARRRKSGYVDGWQPESSVDKLRQTTPRIGLWVDSTE